MRSIDATFCRRNEKARRYGRAIRIYCAGALLEFVIDAELDELEFAFNRLVESRA
jgi:hypothetical protein